MLTHLVILIIHTRMRLLLALAFFAFTTLNGFSENWNDNEANIEFLAYGRVYNPNRCHYYSALNAEIVILSKNELPKGILETLIETRISPSPRMPPKWIALQGTQTFNSNQNENASWSYRLQNNFTFAARGRPSVDQLRFQSVFKFEEQNIRSPIENNSKTYFTIDLSGLPVSCNPDEETLHPLEIKIECIECE